MTGARTDLRTKAGGVCGGATWRRLYVAATMLEIQFGQSSVRGKVRTRNGDATGWFVPYSRQQAQSHGYLFAVADGSGERDGDEAAASTAIAVLTDEFEKAESGAMLISLLPQLIQCANTAVRERGRAGGRSEMQMTTTVVACALRNDQAIVSHVGHSHCYLVRDGRARQVTQDHRDLQGDRTVEGSNGNRPANGLQMAAKSALGTEAFISPDTTALALLPGDVLVLSTDGVHQVIGGQGIAGIASQAKTTGEIARELVARAVAADGDDNATAQVIRVRAVRQMAFHRSHSYGASQ